MTRCAYIFLDESGNFDFSVNGTRYFVLTSVSMRRPFRWLKPINDCKYDCIEYGLDNQYFHCTDDNKHVRGKVFDIIGDHLDAMYIDSLVVEKRKVSPPLWEDRRFYPEMLGHLLRSVLKTPVGLLCGAIEWPWRQAFFIGRDALGPRCFEPSERPKPEF